METKLVQIEKPTEFNFIFGQSHFIKTVSDLYEALVQSSIGLKFGLAFCEASGPCLIRCEGNDPECVELAKKNALSVGCGHSFFIFIKPGTGFPVAVLNAIKAVPEVCRVFCATSNPTQVIVAQSSQGRGVMGVIDGSSPLGVENDDQKKERLGFLRMIGYKL